MVRKYTSNGLWIPQSVYGLDSILEVEDRPRFYESVRQDVLAASKNCTDRETVSVPTIVVTPPSEEVTSKEASISERLRKVQLFNDACSVSILRSTESKKASRRRAMFFAPRLEPRNNGEAEGQGLIEPAKLRTTIAPETAELKSGGEEVGSHRDWIKHKMLAFNQLEASFQRQKALDRVAPQGTVRSAEVSGTGSSAFEKSHRYPTYAAKNGIVDISANKLSKLPTTVCKPWGPQSYPRQKIEAKSPDQTMEEARKQMWIEIQQLKYRPTGHWSQVYETDEELKPGAKRRQCTDLDCPVAKHKERISKLIDRITPNPKGHHVGHDGTMYGDHPQSRQDCPVCVETSTRFEHSSLCRYGSSNEIDELFYRKETAVEKLGRRVALKLGKVESAEFGARAPALDETIYQQRRSLSYTGSSQQRRARRECIKTLKILIECSLPANRVEQLVRQSLVFIRKEACWSDSWIEHVKETNCETTRAYLLEFLCWVVEAEIFGNFDKEKERDREAVFQIFVKNLFESSPEYQLDEFLPEDWRLEATRKKAFLAETKCTEFWKRELRPRYKSSDLRQVQLREVQAAQETACHPIKVGGTELRYSPLTLRINSVPGRKLLRKDKLRENQQIRGLRQLQSSNTTSDRESGSFSCLALHTPIFCRKEFIAETSMASMKKYAGLPDMDEGEEIYETQPPELTEASTLPTESDAASDEEDSALDRATLNTTAARQRFRSTVVDAQDVNFSDTIDGGRKDYRTRSRRRRRRAQLVEGGEDARLSDSDDETLQGRLARLRREAAELQAEIDQIERERESHDADDASTYEDAEDHQTNKLSSGVAELGDTLQAISFGRKTKPRRTLEEEFTQRLDEPPIPPGSVSRAATDERLPESSISAIAAFSDRLTALEAVLGVSAQTEATSGSIIPTLDSLSAQIDILTSALAPQHEIDGTPSTTSTAHLDPLAQKIRHLITESRRLEDSRKAAAKSFEELLENRDRYANLLQSTHSHSAIHPTAEAAHTNGQEVSTSGMPSKEQMQSQLTTLFLDDQASRINALYNVLPNIQSLQPLLPVVLERLRALSVVHTGAADVRNELDEMEQRLQVQEQDVKKWREAVESAEKAMHEGKDVMKENVKIVGDVVKGLEARVKSLS